MIVCHVKYIFVSQYLLLVWLILSWAVLCGQNIIYHAITFQSQYNDKQRCVSKQYPSLTLTPEMDDSQPLNDKYKYLQHLLSSNFQAHIGHKLCGAK